jgi:hypothetical protein
MVSCSGGGLVIRDRGRGITLTGEEVGSEDSLSIGDNRSGCCETSLSFGDDGSGRCGASSCPV